MFFLFEILPRQNYYTDPSSLSPSLLIIITDLDKIKTMSIEEMTIFNRSNRHMI